MNFFIELSKIIVSIIFPLFVYAIVDVYYFKEKREFNLLYKSLFIISSLLITLTVDKTFSYLIVLINIPLIFAYIKGFKLVSVSIAIISIFTCYYLGFSIPILIINYSILFIMFYYFEERSSSTLKIISYSTLINGFFISYLYFYYSLDNSNILIDLLLIFITSVIFYCLCYFAYRMFEEIVFIKNRLNINKNLEGEERFKKTLFKIAHEVKNPLAVCKGYLDMINLSDIEKSKKYINIVKSEMNRSLMLMDDYLNYSKIKINKDIMDINMLVSDTYHSLDELFKSSKAKCSFKESNEEIHILGDYERLKQVLVNVLKNAVEAKRKEIEMIISIKVKIINDFVHIIIKDNGTGMEKDVIENIGEEFFTTKTNGTGLGISISKDIVTKHSGEMFYESVKDEYTKVTIILPVFNVE